MNQINQKNNTSTQNTKKVALSAVLCAVALTIFVIEAQIPLPIPIPGIKLGLANIVTLFALLYLSPKEVFLILAGRILLGSIFASAPSVLIYSFAGGMLALAIEAILLKLLKKKFIVEISICGAMTHNFAQLLCAAAITKSSAVFAYLPFLLTAAFLTGTLCGFCILGIDNHFSFDIINLLKKNKK